jgi:hypothetical protein
VEAGPTRKLSVQAIPETGEERQGQGWFILLHDESWIAPLSRYLESDDIRDWLDHHAERRGPSWHINDGLLKYLPIPRSLLAALGAPIHGTQSPMTSTGNRPSNLIPLISQASAHPISDSPSSAGQREVSNSAGFALPLPGEWEKLASELAYSPQTVRTRLAELERHPRGGEIRSALFIRASRILQHLESTQGRLLSLVAADGRICWKELFEILPRADFTTVPAHPLLRLSGSLPPHLPIARFERTRAPMPGILLMTDSGFHLHMASEDSRILDMLVDQLTGVKHPTWSELVAFLKLPRRMDQVESAASEVLRSHGEQSARLIALRDFLNDCRWS